MPAPARTPSITVPISFRFPRFIPPSNIKLSGQDDYDFWTTKFTGWMLIVPGNLHEMIDEDATPPQSPVEGSQRSAIHQYEAAMKSWKARDEACRGCILYTCSPFAKSLVDSLSTAKEVWERLKSSFQPPNSRLITSKRRRSETLSSRDDHVAGPSNKKTRHESQRCHDWILSTYTWSGTEYHVARDRDAFENYISFDGCVESCDSDGNVIGRALVVGKGTVRLKVRRFDAGVHSSKSENKRRIFDMVLCETLHVPDLPYNVLSYHALQKKSENFTLHGPGTITLEQNGTQVAQFRKVDNLPWYRLDVCSTESSRTELALEGSMPLQGPMWRLCDSDGGESDEDDGKIQEQKKQGDADSNDKGAKRTKHHADVEHAVKETSGKGRVDGTTTNRPRERASSSCSTGQTNALPLAREFRAQTPVATLQTAQQTSTQRFTKEYSPQQLRKSTATSHSTERANSTCPEVQSDIAGPSKITEKVTNSNDKITVAKRTIGPDYVNDSEEDDGSASDDRDSDKDDDDGDEDEDEDENEVEKDSGNGKHREDEDSTDSSDSSDSGNEGLTLQEALTRELIKIKASR